MENGYNSFDCEEPGISTEDNFNPEDYFIEIEEEPIEEVNDNFNPEDYFIEIKEEPTDILKAPRNFDDYQAEFDEELYDKMIAEHLAQEDRETERRAFGETKGHGIDSPAFKGDLNTVKMVELRREGYTLREIAVQMGCSPSTVRNRIKCFNLHK